MPRACSPRAVERPIGYDAGKNTPNRKRYLLVDTGGLLLVWVVFSASMQDRAGAKLVNAGLLTREDAGPGRRAARSLTEASIQLVPVFTQFGEWGLLHRPTTRRLRVRAELLAAGGRSCGLNYGRAANHPSRRTGVGTGWSERHGTPSHGLRRRALMSYVDFMASHGSRSERALAVLSCVDFLKKR